MTQLRYRLNVNYMSLPSTGPRRRSIRTPYMFRVSTILQPRPAGADAIRGILIGAGIAALLWAPILWGASRLI